MATGIPRALLEVHGISRDTSDAERLERLAHLRRTLEAVQIEARLICEEVTREIERIQFGGRVSKPDS